LTHTDLDELVVMARRTRPAAGALAAIARNLRVPFTALPVAASLLPSSALAGVAAKAGLSRSALWGWGAGSTIAVSGVVAAVALSQPPEAPRVEPPKPTVAPQPKSAPKLSELSEPAPTVEVSPEAPTSERRVVKDASNAWGEPELIERARKALAVEPRRALALAQEHQRRFPNGTLGVEREVIVLDALARTGQTAEARRRALAFEKRYPKSIHAPRVRALLARLDTER
jgi:hypothetical protein